MVISVVAPGLLSHLKLLECPAQALHLSQKAAVPAESGVNVRGSVSTVAL